MHAYTSISFLYILDFPQTKLLTVFVDNKYLYQVLVHRILNLKCINTMFMCSSMDGIALNLGRNTDSSPLIEEVNFSCCDLFTLEISENSLLRGFLISCHLKGQLMW